MTSESNTQSMPGSLDHICILSMQGAMDGARFPRGG